MSTSEKPLLQVKGVSKTFKRKNREKVALDQVSFTLGKGEILGIVGESGSGKSTLLRVLSRQISRDSGEIYFLDKPLESFGKDLYQSMQMVFQDPRGSFNPKFTLDHAINELRKHLKIPRLISVGELLQEVGLKPEYGERCPQDLSGGECQRAAIAKAFCSTPKLLLCDEITSALDVSAQAKIVELLIHMVKDHDVSVLFVSHNLALVSSFCDRLLILYKGRVVEEGYTRQVLQNPQEAYTKSLIEAQNLFRKGQHEGP